jgi:hypothetical protein
MDNTNATTQPVDINLHVHQLLAEHRMIAAIWCVEDVQGVRPDLTADQAWEVLEEVGRKHDAEYGIGWITLETMADMLFPRPTFQKETAMNLTIVAIAHHRNGISGAPFHAVLFQEQDPVASRKLGIVFDQQGYCAVLDVAKLAADDIAFGSNSWRGDHYEPHLRTAIESDRRRP